jgi:hypothetical protein
MRGLRLQLTKQQAKDLKKILCYEVTVPKAISAKLKAWGGNGLSQDEMERLSDSMGVLLNKVSNL